MNTFCEIKPELPKQVGSISGIVLQGRRDAFNWVPTPYTLNPQPDTLSWVNPETKWAFLNPFHAVIPGFEWVLGHNGLGHGMFPSSCGVGEISGIVLQGRRDAFNWVLHTPFQDCPVGFWVSGLEGRYAASWVYPVPSTRHPMLASTRDEESSAVGSLRDRAAGAPRRFQLGTPYTSSSSLLRSSLQMRDAQVYEPQIRALLGTASHFRKVVFLGSRRCQLGTPHNLNPKPDTPCWVNHEV